MAFLDISEFWKIIKRTRNTISPLLRKLTEMIDLQYMHFGIGLVNNLSVDRQGNYIIQCQYWNE